MNIAEKTKLEKLLKKEIENKREDIDEIKKKEEENVGHTPPKSILKKQARIKAIEKEKDQLERDIRSSGWETNSWGSHKWDTNRFHPEIKKIEQRNKERNRKLDEIEKEITIKVWADGAEMKEVFEELTKLINSIK